ncbi:MAG: hypothetical protein EB059_08800 [Alphaproteobacteria bacterium]|nr:hypothetical protein [Alphaproteobacteria bacterium]
MSAPVIAKPRKFIDHVSHYFRHVKETDEKPRTLKHILRELKGLVIPADGIRIIDVGIGDGTLLKGILDFITRKKSDAPIFVVGKEYNGADVLKTLPKLAEHFAKHPNSVIVLTNKTAKDAATLARDIRKPLARHDIQLNGHNPHVLGGELNTLEAFINDAWQHDKGKSVKDAMLVISHADHHEQLQHLIPQDGVQIDGFDIALASQPWRTAQTITFKAKAFIAPLAAALRDNGKLIAVQTVGVGTAYKLMCKLLSKETLQRNIPNQPIAVMFAEVKEQICHTNQFECKSRKFCYGLSGKHFKVSRAFVRKLLREGIYAFQIPPNEAKTSLSKAIRMWSGMLERPSRLLVTNELSVIRKKPTLG